MGVREWVRTKCRKGAMQVVVGMGGNRRGGVESDKPV